MFLPPEQQQDFYQSTVKLCYSHPLCSINTDYESFFPDVTNPCFLEFSAVITLCCSNAARQNVYEFEQSIVLHVLVYMHIISFLPEGLEGVHVGICNDECINGDIILYF